MNAYDFDNTILRGDSSFRFFLHCCLRHPRVLLFGLGVLPAGLAFVLGGMRKEAFKHRFFRFLTRLDDAEAEVERFWDLSIHQIRRFYLEQMRQDDLILSASPEFLLRPAMRRLGMQGTSGIIGSRVDIKTGAFDGENCFGAEKLSRLSRQRPDALGQIDAFYSDSLSDQPLADIAERAYLVKGERLIPWPKSS